jgi:hypothetical protein
LTVRGLSFPLHTIKAYGKSTAFVSVLTYWSCLDFIFTIDIKYFDNIKIFIVQVIAPEGKRCSWVSEPRCVWAVHIPSTIQLLHTILDSVKLILIDFSKILYIILLLLLLLWWWSGGGSDSSSGGAMCSFLGPFTKLKKKDYWLCHVCLSIMEPICSQSMDFHEFWYSRSFLKAVKNIHVLLKSDKKNCYFTWRPMYLYHNISLSFS